MSATDEQILKGMDMVRRMVRRYRHTPLGYEDAVGAGSVALVEAGRRFDPDLGVLAAVSKLRRRLRTVLLRHACGVPSREIAADLGVSESRVSQLLATARRRVRTEAGLASD